MRRTLLVTGIALSLALIGCAGEDEAPEEPVIDDPIADEDDPAEDGVPEGDPDEGDPDEGEEPGSGAGDGAAGGSDSREITIATSDVADRAEVDEEDVTFVEFEQVTWSDGALGCPQPDEMYTQALVEGYRLVLEANGERYIYHGAIGDDPFYCADPQEPAAVG